MSQEPLEITESQEVFEFTSVKNVVSQTLQNTEFHTEQIQNLKGISSGFKHIDKITSGFKKGELTTIIAKAGMGKTAFMLSLTYNFAFNNNLKVAIFSSKRPSSKLVQRMIIGETGMSVEKMLSGKLKENEKNNLRSTIKTIQKADIFIDDTPSLSIDELVFRCHHLKAKLNVDIILIDHLELLLTSILDNYCREEQLKKITQSVKYLAKELKLPIILFSQLEKNGDYMNYAKSIPAKDIQDYILENSDCICTLHRPELNPEKNPKVPKGYAEVTFIKHKELKGSKSVYLRFIESIDKFVDSE